MALPQQEIDALIAQVDETRLIKLLAGMVAIPSVNPFDDPTSESCRELEFAQAYCQSMSEVGLTVSKRDVTAGRPNVFGRLSGSQSSRCVMLAGHLDTVGVDGYEDPFNPIVRDGKLFGRGSCDMKAALAAYIEVAHILSDNKIPLQGDLLLAGVADEEHKMLGSKEIKENGPIPDFAIVGEPTELEVCHAHNGQLCMHIKTHGRAVHSSVPEMGINAISHMADVIHALEDYRTELSQREPHPICGLARVNPGVIKGGTISSSVPDYCELEVDRRYIPGENYETIVDEYKTILDGIGQTNPDFNYEISQPTVDNAALDTPKDSEVVTAIAQAFEHTLGTTAKVGAFGAATDAPHFMCDAVICGPGSINQAHTLNEFVEVDQLVASARIYLRTVLNLLS